MALEALSTAPTLTDFIPLSEHESQTPSEFFGGKPVLHLHSPATMLNGHQDQLQAQPELLALAGNGTPAVDAEGAINIPDIDVWVTSRHLLLFSPARATGVQIPYPSITVTAQDGASVLLELNLSDPDTADEDIQFLQLRLIPSTLSLEFTATPTSDPDPSATTTTTTNGTSSPHDGAKALFRAISDCQELNPDPPGMMGGDDDDDYEGTGGMGDPTAPGATGWITSENMADFVDEHGNFRMPEGMAVVGDEDDGEEEGVAVAENGAGLGAGAGRARTAAEVEAEENGVGDGEETKWQRTG